MKIIALVFTMALTGCASAPNWLASMYDNNDPCQLQNNKGVYPSHCGKGNGSGNGKVTRDYYTNRPVYITR